MTRSRFWRLLALSVLSLSLFPEQILSHGRDSEAARAWSEWSTFAYAVVGGVIAFLLQARLRHQSAIQELLRMAAALEADAARLGGGSLKDNEFDRIADALESLRRDWRAMAGFQRTADVGDFSVVLERIEAWFDAPELRGPFPYYARADREPWVARLQSMLTEFLRLLDANR